MSKKETNETETITFEAEMDRLNQEMQGLKVRKNSLVSDRQLKDLQAAQADAAANRIIAIYSELSDATVIEAVTKLHTISAAYPGEPITIVVSIAQGHIHHALALYDELVATRERGHELTVVVRGYLRGAHSILLQAASEGKRLVGPNTFIALEKPVYAMAGSTTDHEEKLELNNRWEQNVLTILASRSKRSVAQIANSWRNFAWELDAQQVIKYGFADAIG